jgi:general secretion pathway protein C
LSVGGYWFMSGVARASTFLLILALAVTATDWVLTFSSRRSPAEPLRPLALGDPVARTQAADIAPIARLLGATSAAEGRSLRLLGIIAQGTRGKGIALIAVDGQPAIAVRAGEAIAADATLTEVRADRVLVSRSGSTQEIRLPARPASEGIVKLR